MESKEKIVMGDTAGEICVVVSCAGDWTSSRSSFGSAAVSQSILRAVEAEGLHLTHMKTDKLNLRLRCNSAVCLLEYFSLAGPFQA